VTINGRIVATLLQVRLEHEIDSSGPWLSPGCANGRLSVHSREALWSKIESASIVVSLEGYVVGVQPASGETERIPQTSLERCS
jgi:hypothetical protein